MQDLELKASELKTGDRVQGGGSMWVTVEDVIEVPERGKVSIKYKADGMKPKTSDYDPDQIFTVKRKEETEEE